MKGLISARWFKDSPKGGIWEDVFQEFKDMKDYVVRWELVLAKDYGVPQNRPRVLMVGVRKDIAEAADLPTYKEMESVCTEPSAVKAGFLPKPSPGKYPNPKELLSDLEDENIANQLE